MSISPPPPAAPIPSRRPERRPPVSVIIPTLNCEHNLRECLTRLRALSYPAELLEVLVVDGGSNDGTGAVAREFGAAFHSYPKYRLNQEARRGVGLALATHEFLLYLDSDNFLPAQPGWLDEMLAPLIADPDLMGSQTLHWTYEKNSTLLTKYFALMGGGDAVSLALGKGDKAPLDQADWELLGRPREKGGYIEVEFEPKVERIPTLGCNPLLTRKTLLLKARSDPDHFFHTDVMLDLIRAGHTRMAICRNASILHECRVGVIPFLQRRLGYSLTHDPASQERRYYILTPHDYPKLAFFVCSSLTLLLPTLRAIRGFYKVREWAWFLHPLLSLVYVFIYIPLGLRLIFSGLRSMLKRPSVPAQN